jgi:hypothetical protein
MMDMTKQIEISNMDPNSGSFSRAVTRPQTFAGDLEIQNGRNRPMI